MSLKAIADLLDTTRSSARRWLREAGIHPISLGRGERARSATNGPRLRPGSGPDNTLSKTCPCSSAAYPAVMTDRRQV